MPLFAVTHLKLKKKSSPKASYPSAEDKRGVMVASHGSFVFPYFYRQLKFSGRLYFSRKAFYYYLSQTWKLSMFSLLKGKKGGGRETVSSCTLAHLRKRERPGPLFQV